MEVSPMSLTAPLEVSVGVKAAEECLTAVDRCFLLGFSRLGSDEHQALESLGRIASSTPLAKPVGEAIAALKQNEFLEKHFTALGVARAAIQGAMHDELRSQVRTALGRAEANEPEWPAPTKPPANVRSWMESTRHWLMEVAIAGFQQVEHPTLAPFLATLEQIQSEPKLTRLGSLLTGFRNELLNSLPISSLPAVPIRRWVDLWTRGVVGALQLPTTLGGTKVKGKLYPLGVDLRHHGFFASADVYSLLESDSLRIVKTTLSSYKVDVLAGSEVWRCFGATALPLLQAITETLTLDVKEASLLPTGDLILDGKTTVGKPFNRLDLAKKYLAPSAEPCEGIHVGPVDRHPVQIAELAYFTDSSPLPLAIERLSPAGEIRAEMLKEAGSVLGLVRFDSSSWSVQPLLIAIGKKVVFIGQTAFEVQFTFNERSRPVHTPRASSRFRTK
jgi:hypothetical protein